ncbi:MAG: hypothetical protein QG661_3160, partial [Actinomycetota bacterium]|nr:hypothetical protein [Actinomycetota bacterium]
MTAQMVVPSVVDIRMAQRLAEGFVTTVIANGTTTVAA